MAGNQHRLRILHSFDGLPLFLTAGGNTARVHPAHGSPAAAPVTFLTAVPSPVPPSLAKDAEDSRPRPPTLPPFPGADRPEFRQLLRPKSGDLTQLPQVASPEAPAPLPEPF